MKGTQHSVWIEAVDHCDLSDRFKRRHYTADTSHAELGKHRRRIGVVRQNLADCPLLSGQTSNAVLFFHTAVSLRNLRRRFFALEQIAKFLCAFFTWRTVEPLDLL